MIELSRTLSPPAIQEKPTAIPGMLTAKEYLTVAGGVLAEGGGRPDFLQEVKDAIPIGEGEARCHYISYKVICMGIIGVINRGLTDAAGFQLLSNLYKAVFESRFSPNLQRAAILAFQNIDNITQAAQGADVSELLPEATSLLINLNSSIDNLRAGDQNWNASIQYQYDPSYWWYAESPYVYWDNTGVKHPVPNFFTSLVPGDFYLNTQDLIRIQSLAPLADFLPDIGIYTAKDEYGNPFVYSSNNAFALPDKSYEYRSKLHFESWVS